MTGHVDVVDLQHLYGLTVASTFPLDQGRPAAGESAPDVLIVQGEAVQSSDETPKGELLLDFGERPDRWYSVVRRSGGTYLLRVYSLCDIVISADLGRATVHMVHGVDPGMRSVMATGTLLSLQLYLRGGLVLHASAVQTADAAIGFMGHSGMGKTTLATLLCADGARLITDDVLPVVLGGEPRVHLGATGLRLRPGAKGLVERFEARDVCHRISADSRHVLTVQPAGSDELALTALIVPKPNRAGRLEMERLSGKAALFAILSFPRLMGWLDRDMQSRLFRQASTLAAKVPVIVAHVPWGPPFRDDVAAQIRESVSRHRRPLAAAV